MTTVVLTHSVGNMDAWLAGGASRKRIFAEFCDGYTVLRHQNADRVSLLCTGVDLAKMKAALGSAAAGKARQAATVLEPIDVFVEVDGAV